MIFNFRNWVLQTFPFLEDDFDALTDYELFCKMMEYVKKFAKDNEDFNKRLTDLENYINNLDLQDEVNKKLDEMATDGTLDEIINQNIFNDLNDEINSVKTSVDNIHLRKMLLLGDSYGSGEIGSSWANNIIDMLTTSGYGSAVNLCVSGAGFSVVNNTFKNQLENYLSNHTDNEEITDIVVAGGYNDNGIDYDTMISAITDFLSYAKTNFPKAKVRVAYIGWKEKHDSSKYAMLYSTYLIYSFTQFMGATYIKDSELAMHNYSFFNEQWDGGFENAMHPNSTGNSFIASTIYNALFNTEFNPCIKRTTTLTSKMTMESWISDKTEYIGFFEQNSDVTSSQYGCEFNSGLDGFETSVSKDKWLRLLEVTPFKDRYVNGGNGNIKVVGTTTAKITLSDNTEIYMPTTLCMLYGNLYMKNCYGNAITNITKVEIPTTILKGEVWTG